MTSDKSGYAVEDNIFNKREVHFQWDRVAFPRSVFSLMPCTELEGTLGAHTVI